MMSPRPERAGGRACWFVGAFYDGTDDQTARFLAEGIWENGYEDKYLDLVKAVQVGDRIAIKSSYTRKHDLPFDNRGRAVSVMAIKAVGEVAGNPGDGRLLHIRWRAVEPAREWYFFTNRSTIWRVLPGDWTTDALISFAFEDQPQDVTRFRNAPFWRDRFGDSGPNGGFAWTQFYEDMSDRLLDFRDKRADLVAGIHTIAGQVDGLTNLQDHFPDGTVGPLRDICPFTALGIFNRGTTDANRRAIARKFASFLGVTEPVPDLFDGIPILNNQRSWFFNYASDRRPGDIDTLWTVFAEAIGLAEADSPESRVAFRAAYDRAITQYGVKWNLTIGLYWARPWYFPTLDSASRRYISKKLGMPIGSSGPGGCPSAEEYLALRDALEARFPEDAFPVHSFPELSQAAWLFKDVEARPPIAAGPETTGMDQEAGAEEEPVLPPIEPYSLEDILAEGCFFAAPALQLMLDRLMTKKNLILQGPPGTGKTWLSKRLAFALIGERNDARVRAVQFHPNLSYEDFVRGWRPDGEGHLDLVDGAFLEMVEAAKKQPTARYVVVIEEINRGNPAQILGEMLTLLEADKRTPNEALELCYRRREGERVYIPDNLYVIGTMNIADRSLALVDLALRRRFAFIDLEPQFGEAWRLWLRTRAGIQPRVIEAIESSMRSLNEKIAEDPALGPQFRVGHSYVTPVAQPIGDAVAWFHQVVETEIGPLLEEYWFDAHEKARDATARLLEGF